MNPKIIAWCLPSVVLSVMVSVRFIDRWLAVGALKLLELNDLLFSSTSDIPDALLLIVSTGSTLLWFNYLNLRRRGIDNALSRLSRLAASVLPLSYLLKSFFKYVFGRTSTRFWLEHQAGDAFHWFHGGGDYAGFPSGHMAVFTAFFAAVWIYYPRYRSISIGSLLILAMALIATDYHFLSDVIAGAYLGLVVTCLTWVFFKRHPDIGYGYINSNSNAGRDKMC